MSSRPPRKHKGHDDMKQETVAQVHKTIKPDVDAVADKLKTEDTNENVHAPSREVSVDEASQINSKILSLIESEMKRDVNKHSHFTDSRPQSLSFYEDEKVPEELSGDLELLSPEERKHYKKRRDLEEMNAYNVIQDLYSGRDGDEIITSGKKSKRKKRHGESEPGIGDSREMMIPREKKKSKRKKRETASPLNGKRKHKKEETTKTEVIVALEELQDDVFEATDELGKAERVKKSPKTADKVYVQRKNKFEVVTKPGNLNRQPAYDLGEDPDQTRKFQSYHPLEIAVPVQMYWMRFTTLCHGLLGGLAFGHWLYIISNIQVQDLQFISHYSHFSDAYVSFFYFLCVVCLISVFERLDFAHFERAFPANCRQFRTSLCVILLYVICLIIHLTAFQVDYKLGLVQYNNDNDTVTNITRTELVQWTHLSIWRSIFAFLAWIIVGLSASDNLFYVNLKNMEKYLPTK